MNLDDFLGIQKPRGGGGKQPAAGQYTAKDFQLEVLGRLEEMQAMNQSMLESWSEELKTIKSQGIFARFDSRAVIALGAIAVSITGYVIQDARNGSRQDSEIEMTKARITNVERTEATNTEARVRTEVELKALREGQEEIKLMLERHENHTNSLLKRKP